MFTLSLKSSVRPSLPSVTRPLCVCACVLRTYMCVRYEYLQLEANNIEFEILAAVVIEHGSLITRLPGRCTITMTYRLGE